MERGFLCCDWVRGEWGPMLTLHSTVTFFLQPPYSRGIKTNGRKLRSTIHVAELQIRSPPRPSSSPPAEYIFSGFYASSMLAPAWFSDPTDKGIDRYVDWSPFSPPPLFLLASLPNFTYLIFMPFFFHHEEEQHHLFF